MAAVQARVPDSPLATGYCGLDTLRLVALALVTWQHAASVLGAYEITQWRGISPGQTGVAIFCAISGFLACLPSRDHPTHWLMKRLKTVYPKYWMVTIASFLLAYLAGSNKSISVGLFVSQMLGTGYFTHGWELINVVSWFISLIVLCYLIAWVIRWVGAPRLCWLAVGTIALVLAASRLEVAVSRHVAAFALGAVLGGGGRTVGILATAVALSVIGALYDPQVFYSGAGALAVWAALTLGRSEAEMVRSIAKYSYEYFLVHGIFLVGVARYADSLIAVIGIATTASCVAAVVLKRLDEFISSN